MISDTLLVQQSLINNLFYLRTLREFSVNIELSFFENNQEYINTAKDFRKKFEELATRTVNIAQNKLYPELLDSEIIVTPYTLDSELLTEKLFGIDIDTSLTEKEKSLTAGNGGEISQDIINEITSLNKDAYVVTQNFFDFMSNILQEMLKNDLLNSISYE